jgi:phosphonoacetate hydrolase
MLDGFGIDYYRSCPLPNLNGMEGDGGFMEVRSLMPSVTNVNNTSICTGKWPEVHGITGNSYFDSTTGQEEFMENDSLVLAPTLFERAASRGVRSKLFSSKRKTIELLKRGTEEVLSPETASADWVSRIGPPPTVYSREVNYWLLDAALYSMVHDTAIGLFYIHTTDYPMHTWAPSSEESKEHLRKLDEYIGRIIQLFPDAVLLITADHSVHHKSLCWDLQKACLNRGLTIRMALSPERDKYVRHHRGFGGCSYVYLSKPSDQDQASSIIRGLHGVAEALTREEAANRFHLMPGRIGDLVVLGDVNTVFGELDTESEPLPETYRSHGSMYETSVPVFTRHAGTFNATSSLQYNFQITQMLFR